MPDPLPNLEQAIRDNAAGPKRAQGDAGSVEQHSLTEQIAAAKFIASAEAAKKPAKTLRLTRLVPPGAEGG